MFPDYYAILGVPTDANIETIRRAYKRLAFESHPDRGGSHERMVRIIAAWEVLSDPIARQRYDNARRHADDPVAQAATNEDSRKAREQAEHYPRKWSEFDVWLENVTNDFAKAEYADDWPTSSVSGKLFAVAGGAGGFLIGVCIYCPGLWNLWSSDQFARLALGLFFSSFLLLVFATAGAGLAVTIHKGIGIVLKSAMRAGSNSIAIVRCSQCGQQLRVPNTSGKYQIKCPKCRHSFTHVAE